MAHNRRRYEQKHKINHLQTLGVEDLLTSQERLKWINDLRAMAKEIENDDDFGCYIDVVVAIYKSADAIAKNPFITQDHVELLWLSTGQW
jgi:hypothetical protein